jgi:hypothetical protein
VSLHTRRRRRWLSSPGRSLVTALNCHAAFEDAKEAFDGVGCHLAPRVFAIRMAHRFMRRELLAGAFVVLRFVGIKRAVQDDMSAKNGLDGLSG